MRRSPHPGRRAPGRRLLGPVLACALVAGLPAVTAAAPQPQKHETRSAQAKTQGLKADYFTHSAPGAFDFASYKATGVDRNLDLKDLEPRLGAATGQTDHVSVRWTGRIDAPRSEAYTFTMTGDNGFRMWIDGKQVIDHWVDDWDKPQTSEPVKLDAGKHDIRVDYFEHEGGSNLHLDWQSPGQQRQPVPADAFSLPEGYTDDRPDSASVRADGRTLAMDFPRELRAPGKELTRHLRAVIGGAEWPLGGVRADPRDPRRLLLTLKEPVVGRGGTAEIFYDGKGGLAEKDGRALDAFWASGSNKSEHQLRTKWAAKVDKNNPHPEYPRPQLARKQWKSLNGQWQFAGAREGERPPFGRNLKERITVPYPVESELSGVGRHEERMWYRRDFTVPRDWKPGDGQRLRLNFEAVDWQSEVYVNGKRITAHKGGYDHFSADVTDALKPGAKKQELVVGVYDPTDAKNGPNPPAGKQRLDPSGIFYTPSSGIWQSVWMEPVAESGYAEDLKLTPDVQGEKLSAEVRGNRAGLPVTATAYDGGRKVGEARGRTGEGALSVPVPKPHLWSPDDPHLYKLKVRVGSGARADAVNSYFGMRSVGVKEIAGHKRTVLNGKPIFNMGTLDQGFWPDGLHTAPTDEALAYDLKMHKKLGYNTVRKHIKVEPARWFYWADKLGLMVWQDMPAMANDRTPSAASRTQYEKEMRTMVEQHHNSPSVTTYVPFNEGWGQYDQARIADQVKAWDPTRLVDNMSGHNCCGAVDGGNGDLSDIHAYPGPGDQKAGEQRAKVTGEYGGLGLAVPGHAWPVQHTYVGVKPEEYTGEYLKLLAAVKKRAVCDGVTGAIYTQISDVEGELNGLMTYDRRTLKADPERLRAAHRELLREGASPGQCARR
ncbi:PA14 domain-containing protein [Streptomyces sp. ODS28]|uniref:PA14 domain-containing protein n=1 Tax=Streptomyces sp. ODS28 TaxID=3136688 RepID=UPI0031EA1B74